MNENESTIINEIIDKDEDRSSMSSAVSSSLRTIQSSLPPPPPPPTAPPSSVPTLPSAQNRCSNQTTTNGGLPPSSTSNTARNHNNTSNYHHISSLKSFSYDVSKPIETTVSASLVSSIPIEIEQSKKLPLSSEKVVENNKTQRDNDEKSTIGKTKDKTIKEQPPMTTTSKKMVSNLKKTQLTGQQSRAKVKFSDVELRHTIKPTNPNSSDDLLYSDNNHQEKMTNDGSNYGHQFNSANSYYHHVPAHILPPHHHHHNNNGSGLYMQHHRPRPYSTPVSTEFQPQIPSSFPTTTTNTPPPFHFSTSPVPTLSPSEQQKQQDPLQQQQQQLPFIHNYHYLPPHLHHTNVGVMSPTRHARKQAMRHSNTVNFVDAAARSRSAPKPLVDTSSFYMDLDRFVKNSYAK